MQDYFIGWQQVEKIAFLRGIQEQQLTGNVVEIQTAGGRRTSFDPKTTQPEIIMERLIYSIGYSPDYDANDPVQLACRCYKRQRKIRSVLAWPFPYQTQPAVL